MELLFLNIGTAELILMLPVFAFVFYSLYHSITNEKLPSFHRMLWFLVILCLQLLGGIAYWVIGRKPVGGIL
ncbi:PLDc N-terminal domain-containing protein [Parapedobacter tibetensis]|uniref:PLDc N-terminal domain-containing protein n=1 Tax=Parapedobacter tibetensis TaxID=2972951 RepID=UPI00214D88AA|nr:PLDc N-terminal domain-containing protein [Parapedobacter tibetensis]